MRVAIQNQARSAPESARIRVLVAIASYGHGNDKYLHRLLAEYRAMPFSIDIVILSNVEKRPAPEIEALVGLPNKNPWSLPFSHKQLFADRLEKYDLFIYSEDDILVTEQNIRAFLRASAVLRDDEIAGFLRIEKDSFEAVNYPDVHGVFHWDCESVRARENYTFAQFTNEHAACYILTRSQLSNAIKSGGFLVEPHEGKYDLLCSAATDPYTQCGLTKLIPISHLDDFSLHHLSNKYVGRVGVDASEMRRQIDVLRDIAADRAGAELFLNGETSLWRGWYSKDYYEPVLEQAISMIPASAHSILSVGCGWGATEISLVQNGRRVVAVPLDPVICATAAASGVEIIYGTPEQARAKLGNMQFDCILYLNVLHLMRDPVQVISLFGDVAAPGSSIIVQTPNMRSIPAAWDHVRIGQIKPARNYKQGGVHFTSKAKIRKWCDRAGYSVSRTTGLLHRRVASLSGVSCSTRGLSLAPEIISVATRKGTSEILSHA